MSEALSRELEQVLLDLSEELDVPPSKYQEAKDHYQAVADWLGEEDSELAGYNPGIYPQGSFALGTAGRPLGDDDFDVDAVCLLEIDQASVTQQRLKAMVGNRLLHPRSRYKDMVDPKHGGRRCWTIKYADESRFHLDVLPAIPDDYGWLVSIGVPGMWAKDAICITDRHTWHGDGEWPHSNPRGYAQWFKYQMRFRLDEGKRALAAQRRADIQGIQDYEIRTPLQRIVQILKRHRDVRYSGDDDKPISIIVTTLAAQAYNNEASLTETLLDVVPSMRSKIDNRDGVWWVQNPVNPMENFADKWAEHPRKAQLFFEWLDAVEREHRQLLTDRGFSGIGRYLAESYGDRDARAVMAKYAHRRTAVREAAIAAPVVLAPRRSSEESRPRVDIPSRPSRPWMS